MLEQYHRVVALLKSHFPYLKFVVEELIEVERHGGDILTYFNDDELCGYLVLDIKVPKGEPCRPHKNCLYISYMGTKKKYRGQGIGRALLLEAKAIAEKQRKPIYTYVASFNYPELNLLYSEGFKTVKVVTMFSQEWLELIYE